MLLPIVFAANNLLEVKMPVDGSVRRVIAFGENKLALFRCGGIVG
jgi:hypothetical protein